MDFDLFNQGAAMMSDYLSILFGCLSVFLPFVIGFGLLFIVISFFISFIRKVK